MEKWGRKTITSQRTMAFTAIQHFLRKSREHKIEVGIEEKKVSLEEVFG